MRRHSRRTAMILAAGRGERMRPLSDTTPKALLEVGNRLLIEHPIARLLEAGFDDLVINTSWLADRIAAELGDGRRYGIRIRYSYEGPEPLETGGGIVAALPLLGKKPFVVLNCDVWCDMHLGGLTLAGDDLATLVLVANPPHKAAGDFALEDGRVCENGERMLTFAGIGIYHPALFKGRSAGRFPLAPILREAMRAGRVAGIEHPGRWFDIGTPERLAALEQLLSRRG